MRPRQTDHEAGDPGKRWEASLQTELYSQKMAHDFLSGSEAMFPPPPYCCLFILEDWDLFQILITRGLSLQAELPHTHTVTHPIWPIISGVSVAQLLVLRKHHQITS